jgi:hypothetical protein
MDVGAGAAGKSHTEIRYEYANVTAPTLSLGRFMTGQPWRTRLRVQRSHPCERDIRCLSTGVHMLAPRAKL